MPTPTRRVANTLQGPQRLLAANSVIHLLVRADVDDLEFALISLTCDAGVTRDWLAPALDE